LIQGKHEAFHVSNLHKYIPNLDHIIHYRPLQLKENLTYVEEPIWIMERGEKKLRSGTIPYVKVHWRHHKTMEATCEPKREIQERYPTLFSTGK